MKHIYIYIFLNKTYKNLFELIKLKSKKSCYSKQSLRYKNNMKKMDCHEEIIGKLHQHKNSKLPRKLIINKKYITLKALRQPRQKFDQKFNILFFYSNLYLHFLRSCCENIFKFVCIVSDKSRN